MLIAEARIETERASRYLDQLCGHAQKMGRHPHYRPRAHNGPDAHTPPQVQDVEWSESAGTIRLNLGCWSLRATSEALLLRIEAVRAEDLRRMQELIAARVEKIGRRDQLVVSWQLYGSGGEADAPPSPVHGHTAAISRSWTARAVVGLVALVIVAHLILGGSVLAASQWWGWSAGAVVVLALVVKAVAMGGFVAHRRSRIVRHGRSSGSSAGSGG